MDHTIKVDESKMFTWNLYAPGGDMLVSLNLKTREMTFGPNYTPDKAAKTFWEALSCYTIHVERKGDGN
jgi:hypothetical protein